MKSFKLFMLFAAALIITACASNETASDTEETPEVTPATETADTKPASSTTTKTETKSAPAATNKTSTTTGATPGLTALTYHCTSGDKLRTISIFYPDTGPKVCEVIYEKSSDRQVLWSASNSKAYCKEKVLGFVEKQESWGWVCNVKQ